MKRPRFHLRTDKRTIEHSDAPYLADPTDPGFIKHRSKSEELKRSYRKVLTTIGLKHILNTINKRKDKKVTTKTKTQTKYTQMIAIVLLTAGAALGFAEQLGGGLKACGLAALLVACLFILAIDYSK